MRYRWEIPRNRRNETGLLYRKIAQRVDVKTAMSPLFRYMRWYASRTPDEIYFLSVDPTAIDRIPVILSLYHPRARSEISEDAELIYPA